MARQRLCYLAAMRVLRGYQAIEEPLSPVVMTIGTYDGLHVGHQAIIGSAVEHARRLELPALVYSFFPPPWKILGKGRYPWLILTFEDKVALMEKLGVDILVSEPFNRDLQAMPPHEFAGGVLRDRLNVRELHFGYDFRFGKDRRGDAEFLRRFFDGTPTSVHPHGAVRVGGEIVGCTRIRKAVRDGDVTGAGVLLGRHHYVRGVVVPGDQRGRTIGFPTANVDVQTELMPPPGVYAVQLRVEGRSLPAVANLGVRPTFDGAREVLEVHALDWSGDLYGQTVLVDFVARIRPEQRFDGKDALISQIERDVEATRVMLPFAPPAPADLTWDPKPA